MAGNMGGQRNTVQSLKVLQSDASNGIVVVHGELQLSRLIAPSILMRLRIGAVSGPNGCLVMIQDALKKPWIEPPRIPRPEVVEAKVIEAEPAKIPA